MLRIAKIAFLLTIFSLPFMKPNIVIQNLAATSTDILFLLSAACLMIAVARGEIRPRWDPLYGVLLAYFAVMLLSTLMAEDPDRAWIKLATQLYLLCLPVLAATLVTSRQDLRAVFRTWLAATAITAAIGSMTVLLFAAGVERPLGGYAQHAFGTLPAGTYTRIESTFEFPAMLCNYLTVSISILLLSRHFGWVSSITAWLLFAMIVVTAAFSLTPGLGGVFLGLGAWAYLLWRSRAAALALMLGAAAAIAFVFAAAVTPILHPTAPFLIELPWSERQLAPAVRMMTWIDAAGNVVKRPFLGLGIGADAVDVRYISPSGIEHLLTDAHNVFLNLAVQCGLLGLAAILFLVAHVARRTSRSIWDPHRLTQTALGLAWLNAFAYQGLTGSYEDARHLWVLLGLIVVAGRTSAAPRTLPHELSSKSAAADPREPPSTLIGGVAVGFAAAPGRNALDFGFQAERQDGSDQHNRTE